MKFTKKYRRSEFLEGVVERNKLLSLPEGLRGPSNNRYNGHGATRMKGYFTKGVTHGPVDRLDEERKKAIAAKLGLPVSS